MRLLINIRPQLRNRISVSQNGKMLYEGTLTDDLVEIDGVSEGEISVGMNSYLIPLNVKANSIVIINDTVSSRRSIAWMAGSLLAVMAIYAIAPHNNVLYVVMLVLLILWVLYFLSSLFRNRKRPERLYKVFIV